MTYKLNDIELSEHLSKLLRYAEKINSLTRENDANGLWKALGEIGDASRLASYRLMDITCK